MFRPELHLPHVPWMSVTPTEGASEMASTCRGRSRPALATAIAHARTFARRNARSRHGEQLVAEFIGDVGLVAKRLAATHVRRLFTLAPAPAGKLVLDQPRQPFLDRGAQRFRHDGGGPGRRRLVRRDDRRLSDPAPTPRRPSRKGATKARMHCRCVYHENRPPQGPRETRPKRDWGPSAWTRRHPKKFLRWDDSRPFRPEVTPTDSPSAERPLLHDAGGTVFIRWKEPCLDEEPANFNAVWLVYIEHMDGRSPNRSFSDQDWSVPTEVTEPAVAAWIEKSNRLRARS